MNHALHPSPHQRNAMHQQPTILDHISWLHRFQGYFDPGHAVWAAQKLLEGLAPSQDSQSAARIDLATGLLRQALVMNPCDPNVRGLLGQLLPMTGSSPDFHAWFEALPQDASGLTMEQAHPLIEQCGDDPEHLEQILTTSPASLVHFLGLSKFWQWGEKERFVRWAERFTQGPYGPATAPLLAWATWKSGDETLTLELLNQGPESFLSLNLKAELALHEGRTDTARMFWLRSLAWEPHQPHLRYRLWELDQPKADPALVEKSKVHIGFYTFNKLATTLRTLESLLASNIGPSQITLLNNGSTAFTSEELDSAVQTLAQGRPVTIIHLPVNIGAPAARNWLFTLPETQEADYLAYLDDDVLLPRDWLACYLQDFQLFLKAVVVGPKGVNPGDIRTIQYVYRYFQETGDKTIRCTNNAPLFMDLGQFDYRRPCLSVMGCCHLFDLKKWNRLGVPSFDIRFSPSQVDDLEHNIQIWKAGGQAVYDGRVAVVSTSHDQRRAPKDAAWDAHVLGNHIKMEHKFTERELAVIDRESRGVDQAFWQDEVFGKGS
ncbi:glycosyltransferase family 2 protein [Desulfonatronum lacustre]|uniref:glycosyltransferase family 2 protein n=1 Tax=Desulfonatronum lacustre TaxID=66849 RepID=UPI0004B9FD5F|nr:glycosyltransferase family 2 protein [Desulfonatronum lacustre]